MMPERMCGSQRLVLEDVEHCAAKMTMVDERSQVTFDEQSAARDIDDIGSLRQARQGFVIQQPPRIGSKGQQANQHATAT